MKVDFLSLFAALLFLAAPPPILIVISSYIKLQGVRRWEAV
jgi:hypothetical protein